MPSHLDYWAEIIGVLSSLPEKGEHIRAVRTGIIPSVLVELIVKNDYIRVGELEKSINERNYNLLTLDGKEIVIDWIRLFYRDFPRSLSLAGFFLKKHGLIEGLWSAGGRKRVRIRAKENIGDFMQKEKKLHHYKHYVNQLADCQNNTDVAIGEGFRNAYAGYDKDKEEQLRAISIAKLHFLNYDVPYLLVPKPP